MFRPLGLYFLGLRDQEHQVDSESQVTMNIMTFMATELKKSPRQASVREQACQGRGTRRGCTACMAERSWPE